MPSPTPPADPCVPFSAATLRPLVGDLRQVASVRRLVLDDGPERGVPVVALSSGGGLDLWLMAGRALDVGPLWFKGRPMAWQSPSGFSHPALGDPERDGGRGFERLFSGFLVTCGLDRIRGAADDGPLHGRLGAAPARVLSAGEQWSAATPVLEVVGEVVQFRLGGESLRLRRTWRVPIGGTALQLEDEVTNEGPLPQSHDLLYHLNLGHPAIATGTQVQAAGACLAGPITLPDTGPVAEARCVAAPDDGTATVRTPQPGGGALQMHLRASTDTLPWLQVWQDLRPTRGVLAIEPCTSERLAGGRSAPLTPLQPGEQRRYRLDIDFSEVA